jgi:hypothetical protein
MAIELTGTYTVFGEPDGSVIVELNLNQPPGDRWISAFSTKIDTHPATSSLRLNDATLTFRVHLPRLQATLDEVSVAIVATNIVMGDQTVDDLTETANKNVAAWFLNR